MSRSKTFLSEDGRALVMWKGGIIRDRLELVVDGVPTESRDYWGDSSLNKLLNDGDPIILEGLGYRATVYMKANSLFSFTYACMCDFTITGDTSSSGRNESYVSYDESPPFASVREALSELEIDSWPIDWPDIEKQYRLLIKKYHPDIHFNKDLPREALDAMMIRFLRISEAWEYLKTQLKNE